MEAKFKLRLEALTDEKKQTKGNIIAQTLEIEK